MHVNLRPFCGQRDGNAAAAGAEVEDRSRGSVERSEAIPGAFGERLGFRAWNEHMTVHPDVQTTEAGGANNLLKRFTGPAPLDQATNGIGFRFGEYSLEIQIEHEPRHLKNVGQQQFRLQPWRVHAFLGQELGAALDDFENRHWCAVTEFASKFKLSTAPASVADTLTLELSFRRSYFPLMK